MKKKPAGKCILNIPVFRSVWTKAIVCVATLVVFCTVYALILPAAAITGSEATEEAGFYAENEGDPSAQEELLARSAQSDTEETVLTTGSESEQSGPEDEIQQGAGDAVQVADAKSTVAGSAETIQPETEENTQQDAAEITDSETEESETNDAEETVKESEENTESAGQEEQPKEEDTDLTDDVSGEEETSGSAEEDPSEAENEETSEAEEDEDLEEGLEEEEAEVFEAGQLRFRGKDYKVVLEYGEKAKIPSNAKLEVKEILEGDEYEEYLKTAADAIDKETSEVRARLFDITILAEGKDGKTAEIQPQDAVKVSITYDEAMQIPEDAEIQTVHIPDKGEGETIDTEVKTAANTDTEIKGVAFETDAFSVFAVVYTVDFHWEVDGKEYDFSIPGGGAVSFSQIAEVLGIAKKDTEESNHETTGDDASYKQAEVVLTLESVEVSEDTRSFVAEVEKIEFSSPELLDVSKVDGNTTVGQIKESRGLECQYSAELTEEQIAEINAQTIVSGDWALISLEPFDSEETLTVTMKNGEQFVIKVLDASYSTNDVTSLVLDGYKGALVNIFNGNVLQSSPHTISGRLNAVRITYDASAHTIETTNPNDRITEWTFTKVSDSGYYIHSSAGYLNMNINGNSGLTISDTPQEFVIQRNNTNGTIRIKHLDNNNAVNNYNNNTNDGYGVWAGGIDNRGEQFKLIELSNAIETIALSPMNENGVLHGNPDSGNVTSTHYKKMTIDGYTIDDNNDANLDRSRIYIPVEYNSNGTATITLPSNNELNSFSVSSADSVTHSITQDPGKYQWVLHGWVNIATGEYYDVTDGSATATVSRDNLNVFYADWWAADYNYTIPESQCSDTVDTSSYVTIKMFDYNEMFNLHSSDVWKVDGDSRRYISRDTIESEEWYIKNGPSFQFVDNTDQWNAWQYGTLGNTQDRGRYNYWSNYSNTGTLGILGKQGEVPSTGVLEGLFSESNTPGSGVNYLGQGNYLFHYDENSKIYSYDSDTNGAVYNQEEERFYVSTSPRSNHWRGGGGGYREDVGFFPLNDATSRIEYNNGTTNNWFGMRIDMDFWLPDTPGSSTNANLLAEQAMKFEFRGDDDVWVLIDGKLALDIGGIHEAVEGSINFSNGEIRNAKGNIYHLSDMGIGAGAHTLSFYYLEQGGNASNCKITFNLVPRWEEEPVKKGTAKVTKTWSDDTPDEAKEALSFWLETNGVAVEGSTIGYEDGKENAEGVWSYMWTGLDPDKTYVVVEGADPRFTQEHTSRTVNVSRVWALASYHKNDAFGSTTIALGNGRRSSDGGQLLNGTGGVDAADIDADIVRSEVGDSAKWTVEGYTTDDQHFYLKNSSGKYLSIKNGSIALVDTEASASWFYMSPSGDLNDANSDYRLKVDDDGNIVVGGIVNSADETDTDSPDRIHIYRYYDNYETTTEYDYVNTFNRKAIQVTKAWSDSPGVDHSEDTITIGLYQLAVDSSDEVVAEVVYPIEPPNPNTITGSKTITISGLPVAGVYEGQFVTYQYQVVEISGKVGYISQIERTSEGEDEDQWTITNVAPDEQDKTTSVSVKKEWKHPDGTEAASDHENDEIEFKLLQRAVESNYVPVTINWGRIGQGVQETQEFYIEKGGNLTLTITRTTAFGAAADVYISTNRSGDNQVLSDWGGSTRSQNAVLESIKNMLVVNVNLSDSRWGDRWSHSVNTSNLKSSIEEVVEADATSAIVSTGENSYTLTKESISEGPFDESAANWVATINGLPLYKKISNETDGSGTYYTYYYSISEISVNGESVLPANTTTTGQATDFIVSIDQDKSTITNTEKEKIQAAAEKVWSNADGSSTPPDDASVIFELYADGESTGKMVILNGKEDVAANPNESQELIEDADNSPDAYEVPAWAALWSDLPQYEYKQDGSKDHEIVYTIKEVPESIPEGYEAVYGTDGEEEAANGGTITNRQLTTSLEIIKVDADGMETLLEGAKFELRKIDPDDLHYLDDGPTLPTTTGTGNKTGTDGKATFDGMTSGYYEIKETELPTGYVLTGDGKFYIKVANGTVAFVRKNPYGIWVENEGNEKLILTPASGDSPATAKVGNEAGAALPSAGGPGTKLFTILGGMMMLGAGMMFFRKRRR